MTAKIRFRSPELHFPTSLYRGAVLHVQLPFVLSDYEFEEAAKNIDARVWACSFDKIGIFATMNRVPVERRTCFSSAASSTWKAPISSES
jgi:hypothetical protein